MNGTSSLETLLQELAVADRGVRWVMLDWKPGREMHSIRGLRPM
jgi:hypothetical protein